MLVELEITTGHNGITILQPVMLARLAKHGAFYGVKVPVGVGVAAHPYRVLLVAE